MESVPKFWKIPKYEQDCRQNLIFKGSIWKVLTSLKNLWKYSEGRLFLNVKRTHLKRLSELIVVHLQGLQLNDDHNHKYC